MSKRIIETTMVGSLPRVPPPAGKTLVEHHVACMKRIGLTRMCDGEWSKPSYVSYIAQRCSGFGGKARSFAARDMVDFPRFAKQQVDRKAVIPVVNEYNMACIGEVAVKDRTHLERDVEKFIAALETEAGVDVRNDLSLRATHFFTAASPGVITLFLQNQFYPTHDAYLAKLSEVMQQEYEEIVLKHGFQLQIDCPDLAMGKNLNWASLSMPKFIDLAEKHVDALNKACRNIPAEMLRMHLCWGNWEGPHHHDIDLPLIWNTVLKAKPKYILLESANPRHAHQVSYFEQGLLKLPDDKVLVPGVIDSTSNYVEHPDLVARRILEWVKVVGPSRVIAGTDCGFGTFDCVHTVHPDLVWPKLEALCEGAKRASSLL